MRWHEVRQSIYSDLYRFHGQVTLGIFLKAFLLYPGFTYMVYLRCSRYCSSHIVFKYNLYFLAGLLLQHYKIKYGINIPWKTEIGQGFYIGHPGGIDVHSGVKIGENCNISQGVTIGQTNRGKLRGVAVIGDNVYIGPGVRIIGNVKIGNDVAIGANCVVTKDIPDHGVVVGVPGRIISYNGAKDYVNYIDYKTVTS